MVVYLLFVRGRAVSFTDLVPCRSKLTERRRAVAYETTERAGFPSKRVYRLSWLALCSQECFVTVLLLARFYML